MFSIFRRTPILPVLALLSFFQTVHSQQTASTEVGPFYDEVGIMVDGSFVPGIDAAEGLLAGNPVLFENHSGDYLPVLKPDGSTQVTYNEFSAISGTATLLDVEGQGTRVTLSLDGLIPEGVYTIWTDYYAAPGFTPDFAHELGAGALAYDANNPPANPNDFVGNVLVAGANGRGVLETIQPAGSVSWFTTELGDMMGFEVPAYALDAPVFELDLFVAYHIDSNTWGPRPGAGEGFDAFDATWVGQGVAAFVVPEPSAWSVLMLGGIGLLMMPRRRSRFASLRGSKLGITRSGGLSTG